LQSKFGKWYGYEHKRPDRLPSIEMLSNPLNIRYLIRKFDLQPNQLCIFALIRKEDKILMGLREYVKGKPVWTYPGGRGEKGETLITSLTREIKEEIGVENINFLRVIGQKQGVKKGDKVYFVETEISEEPRLMEPDLFKEWKWFKISEIPENLIDPGDVKIIKRIFN
jgi:8-oxo-dGTP diphosphatase